METQITKRLDILTENLQKVQNNLDDTKTQLDKDRADLNRLRGDMARIGDQQDSIIKTMVDFKAEVRQTLQDTIPQAVAKAVKKELEKIGFENPKKVFFVKKSIIDRIKSKFKYGKK